VCTRPARGRPSEPKSWREVSISLWAGRQRQYLRPALVGLIGMPTSSRLFGSAQQRAMGRAIPQTKMGMGAGPSLFAPVFMCCISCLANRTLAAGFPPSRDRLEETQKTPHDLGHGTVPPFTPTPSDIKPRSASAKPPFLTFSFLQPAFTVLASTGLGLGLRLQRQVLKGGGLWATNHRKDRNPQHCSVAATGTLQKPLAQRRRNLGSQKQISSPPMSPSLQGWSKERSTPPTGTGHRFPEALDRHPTTNQGLLKPERTFAR